MNEQIIKGLKIAGIVILVLFAWGLWNIITGGNRMAMDQSTELKNSMLDYSGEGESFEMSLPGASDGMPARMTEDSASSAYSSESGTANVGEIQAEKKVKKNGTLSLKVKKTEEAVVEISKIAVSKGGEIFSTNLSERIKGKKSGTIVVKVPTKEFENAIEMIKGISTQVINEYTSGQDVTEQYVDLQAQLKNKQAEEQSFVRILDQSGKIDDVLAVTREVSRVRGDIERLQGKIRYLDSQTDMATITVSLSEDIEVAPVGSGWRPGQVLKQSISDLVKSTQNFIDSLIRFVIVGLPSLLLFIIILGIAWWTVKKVAAKFRK